jgi:hypothetical protein
LDAAGSPAQVSSLAERRSTAKRWWLVAAAAVTLALASALAMPESRTTVAGWLGLDGVRFISSDEAAAPPVGGTLELGDSTELEAAASELEFAPLIPTDAEIGEPDEVYISDRAVGGMLALVYRAEDGLPESGNTGAGLLLTQFQGALNPGVMTKGIGAGTLIEEVEVAGERGIWIEGDAHLFFYTDPSGAVVNEDLRLAGNTLLWETGGLTLRLEGELPREEMRRIAESLAPLQ